MKIFRGFEYSFFLLLLFIFPVSANFPAFDAGEGIYITEVNSGDDILTANEKELYYPASTTKLMTALLTVETVDNLDEVVTVGTECDVFGWEDSEAGLWAGQKLTYRDLLYALLLPSGNDAADTLGINVGRKILNDPNASRDDALHAFVNQMNKRAVELGAESTNFVNTHGLFNPLHYSTPYDMVQIAKKAFENETIVGVSQTPTYNLMNSDGTVNTITNTNRLITGNDQERSIYVLAGKTGSTDEGGRTFLFSSRQGDAFIVGSLMKTSEHGIFDQSRDVLLELNNNYITNKLTNDLGIFETVKLSNVHFRDNPNLSLRTYNPVYNYTRADEKDNYTTEIRYDEEVITQEDNDLRLNQSVKAGDKVGALIVSEGNGAKKTIPLYAGEDISAKNLSDFILEHLLIIVLIGIILAIIIWAVVGSLKVKYIQKRF